MVELMCITYISVVCEKQLTQFPNKVPKFKHNLYS